jgi:hypothetical protein
VIRKRLGPKRRLHSAPRKLAGCSDRGVRDCGDKIHPAVVHVQNGFAAGEPTIDYDLPGQSPQLLPDAIVSQGNPETKRGKELHEPDRMYLNPSQIVFVESVGTNSKVAQLIAEQKKQ